MANLVWSDFASEKLLFAQETRASIFFQTSFILNRMFFPKFECKSIELNANGWRALIFSVFSVDIHSTVNHWNKNSKQTVFFSNPQTLPEGFRFDLRFVCILSRSFLLQTIGGWIKWYSMIAPQPAIEASNIYVFVLIPRHVKTRFRARGVLFEKFFPRKMFPSASSQRQKSVYLWSFNKYFHIRGFKKFSFSAKKHFSLFIYRQVSMGLALCASVVSNLHTRFRAYRRVFPHTRCERRQTRPKKQRKI